MKPLEDGLEGMIETGKLPDEKTPVGAYLKANPAALEEVSAMMDLSKLIRDNFQLSAEEREEVEPAPGFYSRVLARLESQALPPSIWNFFLEPFGMRLVYASLALAVLLFTATIIDSASSDEQATASNEFVEAVQDSSMQGAFLASDSSGAPVVESANPNEDRGAALMQLTTYDQ